MRNCFSAKQRWAKIRQALCRFFLKEFTSKVEVNIFPKGHESSTNCRFHDDGLWGIAAGLVAMSSGLCLWAFTSHQPSLTFVTRKISRERSIFLIAVQVKEQVKEISLRATSQQYLRGIFRALPNRAWRNGYGQQIASLLAGKRHLQAE